MRYITALLKETLPLFPATLLLGARQMGKSTLAHALVDTGLVDQYITLDDLSVLSLIQADPDGFLKNLSGSAVLDEIQRVPDLMRALKKSIDENRQKGRFLLTGSANVLAHPAVRESLAGRMDVLILEGLSLAERLKLPTPCFFKTLLQESLSDFKSFLIQAKKNCPLLSPQVLQDSIFFGGYPEVAMAQNTAFAERYFQAYQTTYIEKDIRDLARGIDIVQFSQVAKSLLLQTGNLLNYQRTSTDMRLDQRTVKRYQELLEMTFQIIALEPWSRNPLKRTIKTPKIYAQDSGIASFVHHIRSPSDLPHSSYFGAIFETFFFAELRKQLQFIPGAAPFFYRTHAGAEVDFVLEYGPQWVGLELKASHSVNPKDFKGLRDLQDAHQSPLKAGIVLYQGDEILFVEENLMAIPLRYALLSSYPPPMIR